MKLHVYLATIEMTVRAFSKIVDYNPTYISRVSKGYLYPGRKFARRVKEVTGGQVILEEGKDWQRRNSTE